MLSILCRRLLPAAIFCSAHLTALAQPLLSPPRWFLGGTIGYLSSFQDDFFSMQPPAFQRTTFATGIGTSFYGGVSGKYIALYRSRTSIVTALTYNRLPATFGADGPTLPATDQRGDTIQVETARESTLNHDLVKLDLLLEQPLFHIGKRGRIDIGLALGPSIAWVAHSSVREMLYMWGIYDQGVRFLPGDGPPGTVRDQSIEVASGKPDGLRSLRVGLRGGAYMEFAPFNRYLIRPGVYFDYGLTSGARESRWKSHAIQVGLDLMLPITDNPDPSPDTPPTERE